MAKRRGRPPGRATQAAQSFSAMLGTVAARVDGWLAQRDDIVQELDAVIERAQGMLSALGKGGDHVPFPYKDGKRRGRAPGSSNLGAATPGAATVNRAKKRRKMSPEARAKIAAAQRARWARQKGESETSGKAKKAKKSA